VKKQAFFKLTPISGLQTAEMTFLRAVADSYRLLRQQITTLKPNKKLQM
jgi:hypothetical protein